MKSRFVRSFTFFLVLTFGAGLPAAAQQAVPATIAGVVNAGTPIQLVKDGSEAVEGPLPQLDDGLLFTTSRANRVLRLAPDGVLSVWFEGPGGANALTRTPEGDIVATLTETRALAVIQPRSPPTVLVSHFEGTPFYRPNDLIASARGDIYFTDLAPPDAPAVVGMPSAVYQLTEDKKLLRVATDIAMPNGIALSPDERTLYVTDTAGEWVYAFELNRGGNVKERTEFARLAMPPQTGTGPVSSGADGLAVDEKGRLYVATALGVQVFSPKGEPLGVITLPKQPQNLAFSGYNRSMLFVVGGGAVYRIATLTRGPHRSGK
jgi:gluconolactonase